MSWTCSSPSCGTLVAFDDLNTCPVCGQEKQSWTLKPEQTRTLTIAAPKVRLSCRRGETFDALELDGWVGPGIAWRPTKQASVLTKEKARQLMDARGRPDPHDLLCVRMAPAPSESSWTLTIAIGFEALPVEERALEFERAPDDLDEQGRFDALFLCVSGPGAADDLRFPLIHVLDVTEETALGHAPTLEVRGFRVKAPIVIELGERKNDVECGRGHLVAAGAGAPGVSWRRTEEASVLTTAQAKALLDARRLPDPRDLLRVRLTPGESPAWAMTLTPKLSKAAARAVQVELTADAEGLDAAGRVDAHFLLVRGPDAASLRFPYLQVIDVSDATPLGHAPTIDVAGPKQRPVTVRLGSAPVPPPPPGGKAKLDIQVLKNGDRKTPYELGALVSVYTAQGKLVNAWTSNAQGWVAGLELAPGEYAVRAQTPSTEWTDGGGTIALVAGKTHGLGVAVRPEPPTPPVTTGKIVVKAVRGGAPAGGQKVTVSPIGVPGATALAGVTTLDQGTSTFEVAPGQYRVMAVGFSRQAALIDVAAGATETVTLSGDQAPVPPIDTVPWNDYFDDQLPVCHNEYMYWKIIDESHKGSGYPFKWPKPPTLLPAKPSDYILNCMDINVRARVEHNHGAGASGRARDQLGVWYRKPGNKKQLDDIDKA